MLALLLHTIACGPAETCNSSTVGDCDVETCCAGDVCTLSTDDATYNCDGADCSDASEEVVEDCDEGAGDGSCDTPDGYTCDASEVGNCPEVQTCCTTSDCLYMAGCETFECDGTDCEDAAADLVAYCN
jgi:hypothetical protein